MIYFHLINNTYEKEAYFIQLNMVENKKKDEMTTITIKILGDREEKKNYCNSNMS